MGMKPNAQVAERFWMVWRETGCEQGMLTKVPTRKHPTEADAITEAERLAQKHHGAVFHVLESVGFAQRIVPSSFTYVAD